MDLTSTTGIGGGQKSGKATISKPPIAVTETATSAPAKGISASTVATNESQAAAESTSAPSLTTTDIPILPKASSPPVDTSVDMSDSGNVDTMDIDVSDPPKEPLPEPTPGMSLPTWLKLVTRPEASAAIDQFQLLDAYETRFKGPHVDDKALVRMIHLIHPDVCDWEGEESLWFIGIRWLNEAEANLARKSGRESSHGGTVSSELKNNVAKVLNFALTVGNGKLPLNAPAASEGAAERVVDSPLSNAATFGSTSPSRLQEGGNALNSDLLEPPPKRDLAQELAMLKASCAFESIYHWLCEVLTKDKMSFIDIEDVKLAYDANDFGGATKPHVDNKLMTLIMAHIYNHGEMSKCGMEEDGWAPSLILGGVGWREIARPVFSTAIPYHAFPEKLRNEAHKLLHLPDPERTKLWLQTQFKLEPDASLSLMSMYEFYERVHWRWADTHEYLDQSQFTSAVQKTFQGSRVVEVSKDYEVILGVTRPYKSRSARELLAKKQTRDLRRLERRGEVDAPKSLFAQKLRDDPLLMCARTGKKDTSIPGSFESRTRRRAGGKPGGERAERQPFGDEEPGFPGLCMKRVQVQYKTAIKEEAKRMLEAEKKALEEAQKAMATAPPPLPSIPPPPANLNANGYFDGQQWVDGIPTAGELR